MAGVEINVEGDSRQDRVQKAIDALLKGKDGSVVRQEVVDLVIEGEHVVRIYEGDRFAAFQGRFVQVGGLIPEVEEFTSKLEAEGYGVNLD